MDTIIVGESVDLVTAPDTDEFYSAWASWFNDKLITRDIHQGAIPHTATTQRDFYNASRHDRLILFIKPKELKSPIGVCSISNITPDQRKGDFAMIIGQRKAYYNSAFAGLEAKALLTQYAFSNLPIDRINSSQSIRLLKWQRYQFLLGYLCEGITSSSFIKNGSALDETISSALRPNVQRLIDQRGGSLWPGTTNFLQMIRNIPQLSLAESIQSYISDQHRTFLELAHAISD
jgi:RimJ/RimL family protein N-acetyltransferase